MEPRNCKSYRRQVSNGRVLSFTLFYTKGRGGSQRQRGAVMLKGLLTRGQPSPCLPDPTPRLGRIGLLSNIYSLASKSGLPKPAWILWLAWVYLFKIPVCGSAPE